MEGETQTFCLSLVQEETRVGPGHQLFCAQKPRDRQKHRQQRYHGDLTARSYTHRQDQPLPQQGAVWKQGRVTTVGRRPPTLATAGRCHCEASEYTAAAPPRMLEVTHRLLPIRPPEHLAHLLVWNTFIKPLCRLNFTRLVISDA